MAVVKSSANQRARQLWSTQYLRALAALGVVLFHVLEATSHKLPIGAAGVDVSFVISGFIIFSVTAIRPVTPMRFLADRIARVVPTYWIATVATFLCATVDLRILTQSDASQVFDEVPVFYPVDQHRRASMANCICWVDTQL